MATLLNPGTEADLEETVKEGLANAARTWTEAQSNEIIPAPYTVKEDELHESISRGHKLFVENCLNCHIDYGRKETLKWDEWGTVVRPGNLTRMCTMAGTGGLTYTIESPAKSTERPCPCSTNLASPSSKRTEESGRETSGPGELRPDSAIPEEAAGGSSAAGLRQGAMNIGNWLDTRHLCDP